MGLKLYRPLAGIDLETTGVKTEESRIIEIGLSKLNPDFSRESKRYLINPGVPIPETATAVHGITDDMVKDYPPFSYFANEIYEYLFGCDVAGFNSNRFDIPLLFKEFSRVGIAWNYRQFSMVDVRNIYVQREERTLAAAHQFYLGKPLQDAHSAEADIDATMNILLAQYKKYPDLPETIEELALYSNYGKKIVDISGNFTYDGQGQVIYNFGPHIDKVVTSELGFLDWMLKKEFPEDTKKIARHLLNKAKQK